jgi:hypothetical protein
MIEEGTTPGLWWLSIWKAGAFLYGKCGEQSCRQGSGGGSDASPDRAVNISGKNLGCGSQRA